MLTREDFVGVTRNAMAGLGFDQDVSMVVFPIDPFLVDSDISPIGEALQDFVDGLTSWRPAANEIGVKAPPRVPIEANGYEAAVDKMNRLFLTNTWGDGLPLNPPSMERVDWILTGTDMDRDDIIGKFMPRGGVATVETIAVSLAMAGGRPEYLPVLIAAVDGFLDPGLEHDKVQATSGSTFPIVIVNGPIAEEIRLNSGFGLLGPDPQHPAGASIGRALRLLRQNVGGALPGVGTMAIFGAMRYTNAAASGWDGDEVLLLKGPQGGSATVLLTWWDDEAEAKEFARAMDPLLAQIGKGAGYAEGQELFVQLDAQGLQVVVGVVSADAAVGIPDCVALGKRVFEGVKTVK